MDVPDDDDDLNANSAFLGLPDDILICILGFLDIPTQLLLTKLHPRLLEIMPNVWRSENKHATLNLFEKSISNRDLNFLLESTQKTLKCLRLKMEDRRTWDILTNYVYPSVNDFRFSTYSFMLNNSDVPKMIQSFPNLRTLSPFGNFTGENFENFQFLENLTVTYCKLLQIDHLGNILKTRKIKSLQLNVFDFDRFVPAINLPLDGIKNLETIHCFCGEFNNFFLMNCRPFFDLKHIFICDEVSPSFLGKLLSLSSYRKINMLEIYKDYKGVNLFRGIEPVEVTILKWDNELFLKYYGCFDNIKEIYLKNCLVYSNRNDCEMFLNCPKTCEILGLDKCHFDVEEFTFAAQEIGSDRLKTLNIHLNENTCFNNLDPNTNEELPVIWNVLGEHEFFKLHMNHPNITFNSYPVSVHFE